MLAGQRADQAYMGLAVADITVVRQPKRTAETFGDTPPEATSRALALFRFSYKSMPTLIRACPALWTSLE